MAWEWSMHFFHSGFLTQWCVAGPCFGRSLDVPWNSYPHSKPFSYISGCLNYGVISADSADRLEFAIPKVIGFPNLVWIDSLKTVHGIFYNDFMVRGESKISSVWHKTSYPNLIYFRIWASMSKMRTYCKFYYILFHIISKHMVFRLGGWRVCGVCMQCLWRHTFSHLFMHSFIHLP